ncbi:hypothetical protein ACCC88_12805 [Sphingomonas sp. Sphisp140]|uniref:hypothetical protein n=1 Tax=Sphingomonas sp. Sphisp66 TaxID=3243051 RepID=UPI0039B518ED
MEGDVKRGEAQAFARKLAGATMRACHDYRDGDLVHEEPFSDQLCGRLKETLHDFQTGSIAWQVDVAPGRGRLSARSLTKTKEEPVFGADIVMTIDIETSTESVRKGFLAQAKRLEPGKLLSNQEHRRLLDQCEKMVSFTPCSMVFLYHREGLQVIPASAVLGSRHMDLWDIEAYPIDILYEDFGICWFGDMRIQATDPASLEGLRAMLDTRVAVRLAGRQAPDDAFEPEDFPDISDLF